MVKEHCIQLLLQLLVLFAGLLVLATLTLCICTKMSSISYLVYHVVHKERNNSKYDYIHYRTFLYSPRVNNVFCPPA